MDDLVEGLIRPLHSPLAGPVNLGSPAEMSVLDLADLVRRLCESSSEIVFVPRPEDDPAVRQPDITLARRALGWEPKVPIEAGLRRVIGWFRAGETRHAGPPAATARSSAPDGARS